jgi:pimeloyl-ACP methyl ester carboxylesterase
MRLFIDWGRSMRATAVLVSTLVFLAAAPPERVQAAPIPPGQGEQTVNLGADTLTVFTYRPQCDAPNLLLVFHGLNRTADRYRGYAQPLADRLCMIVVAPLFDKERFPTWAYQRGGIVHGREVQDPRDWTGRLVVTLIAWARKTERRPLTVSMIGHSAGGQFLSRLAAFVPTDAQRIVIANPSTHVFPSLDTPAPFGMGRVYRKGDELAQLRRYLATPVTIFLGADDVGDKNRNDSEEAQAQGATRYERGRNAFKAGQRVARARGWAFNWRLVEAPGVAHSARHMFSSAEAIEALKP